MPDAEVAVLKALLKIVQNNQKEFSRRLDNLEKEQARCEVKQAMWQGKLIGLSIAGSMVASGLIAWLVK